VPAQFVPPLRRRRALRVAQLFPRRVRLRPSGPTLRQRHRVLRGTSMRRRRVPATLQRRGYELHRGQRLLLGHLPGRALRMCEPVRCVRRGRRLLYGPLHGCRLRSKCSRRPVRVHVRLRRRRSANRVHWRRLRLRAGVRRPNVWGRRVRRKLRNVPDRLLLRRRRRVPHERNLHAVVRRWTVFAQRLRRRLHTLRLHRIRWRLHREFALLHHALRPDPTPLSMPSRHGLARQPVRRERGRRDVLPRLFLHVRGRRRLHLQVAPPSRFTRREGAGRAVLLLGGSPSPASAFTPLAQALSADHRVLNVSAPGYDGSATDDRDLTTLTPQLETTLDALGTATSPSSASRPEPTDRSHFRSPSCAGPRGTRSVRQVWARRGAVG